MCDVNVLNQFQLAIASRRPGINGLEFSRSRCEYDSRFAQGTQELFPEAQSSISDSNLGFAFAGTTVEPESGGWPYSASSRSLCCCPSAAEPASHRTTDQEHTAQGRTHVEAMIRETRAWMQSSGPTWCCCQPRVTGMASANRPYQRDTTVLSGPSFVGDKLELRRIKCHLPWF